MDDENQTVPQEPVTNLPQQTSGSVIEPQQTFTPPTLPPAKSKKRVIMAVVLILLFMAAGAAAWFVVGKKDKPSSTPRETEENNQTSQLTADSDGCAYVPKQNYAENEGLYSLWRENAKKVNFSVYLPCKFDSNFNLQRLGIGAGDDNEVMNVFLGFNRPEPESGEDGLTDDSNFSVIALPSEHKPPTQCLVKSIGTTNSQFKSEKCVKLFDSKFGPVYENSLDDLLITIENSLVIWSYPPFDVSVDTKPVLEIVESLQKVDPTTLEFYNY